MTGLIWFDPSAADVLFLAAAIVAAVDFAQRVAGRWQLNGLLAVAVLLVSLGLLAR